jgi:hypothetical protein
MGMYERAALIGAQFQVQSEPDADATITVRAPLTPASESDVSHKHAKTRIAVIHAPCQNQRISRIDEKQQLRRERQISENIRRLSIVLFTAMEE